MYKKVSRKAIDALIDSLIDSVKKGKFLFNQKDSKIYNSVLDSVFRDGSIEGLDKIVDFKAKRGAETINPQNTLLELLDLGLISKKKHLRFLLETKTVIETEIALSALKHSSPELFAEFYFSIKGKPLRQKRQFLAALAGINFSYSIELHKKFSKVNSNLNYAMRIGKGVPAAKAAFTRIKNQVKVDSAKLLHQINARIAKMAYKPTVRGMLKRSLRPRTDLSGREMNILFTVQQKLSKKNPAKKTVGRHRRG